MFDIMPGRLVLTIKLLLCYNMQVIYSLFLSSIADEVKEHYEDDRKF